MILPETQVAPAVVTRAPEAGVVARLGRLDTLALFLSAGTVGQIR